MSLEPVFTALILGVGILWTRAPFLIVATAIIPAITPGVGAAVVAEADPPVAAAVAVGGVLPLLDQNSLANSPPLKFDDCGLTQHLSIEWKYPLQNVHCWDLQPAV